MPLTMRPDSHYEYTLSTDEGRDDATPIKLKYVTANTWLTMAELMDAIEATDSGAEKIKLSRDIVQIGLTPDQEAILDALTMPELIELRMAVIRQNITGDDKKKSESPSP